MYFIPLYTDELAKTQYPDVVDDDDETDDDELPEKVKSNVGVLRQKRKIRTMKQITISHHKSRVMMLRLRRRMVPMMMKQIMRSYQKK